MWVRQLTWDSVGKADYWGGKEQVDWLASGEKRQELLVDHGEVVGEIVATKPDAKPFYVSIGHMVSLESAVKTVKHCSKGRIPEPRLQAHNLATKQRTQLFRESKVNI